MLINSVRSTIAFDASNVTSTVTIPATTPKATPLYPATGPASANSVLANAARAGIIVVGGRS
jgi:hypothetical protein